MYACAHSSAPFTFLDVLDVTFFSFVHDVLLDPDFGRGGFGETDFGLKCKISLIFR